MPIPGRCSIIVELTVLSCTAVAEGYGGVGVDITTTARDVKATLEEAQRAAAGGAPVLVNVHIGTTSFREGSLSV
jgi:hypothetical protein